MFRDNIKEFFWRNSDLSVERKFDVTQKFDEIFLRERETSHRRFLNVNLTRLSVKGP